MLLATFSRTWTDGWGLYVDLQNKEQILAPRNPQGLGTEQSCSGAARLALFGLRRPSSRVRGGLDSGNMVRCHAPVYLRPAACKGRQHRDQPAAGEMLLACTEAACFQCKQPIRGWWLGTVCRLDLRARQILLACRVQPWPSACTLLLATVSSMSILPVCLTRSRARSSRSSSSC